MFQFRSNIRHLEQKVAAVGEKFAQEISLCESDLRILEFLKMNDEQPVNELGAKIGLTSGSMTAALKRLEKKEFVERRPHQSDRRKVTVCLEKKGKQWLKDVRKEHASAIAEELNFLSEREQRVFVELLARIAGGED